MKYYKTSNLSIQDNNINSIYFVNELLYPFYNDKKYVFFKENYDTLRKNIVNGNYDDNKIKTTFYDNNILILRKKDNKIIKLPKLKNNNNNTNFNYSFFIHLIKKSKKNPFYFCDSNKILDNYKTINGILYLYYQL